MTLSMITFLVQFSLITYLLKDSFQDGKGIYIGDDSLNVVRLAATYIMHLYLYPEVKVSL